MTNATPSTDTLSRASSATANFLTALNPGFNQDSSLSSLFDNLLAATTNITVPAASTGATTAANANAASGNNMVNGSTNPPLPTTTSGNGMEDITTALQNFAAKWTSYQQSQKQHNNGQNDATPSPSQSTSAQTPQNGQRAGTATSTTTASASSTSGTTTSTAKATAAGSSGATDSASTSTGTGTATDPTAPPSLADVLAQLQAILHMLQKQMTTAQAGGDATTPAATDSTTATGSATPAQDLLAAGGALGDLLALAQMLEKKLGQASPSDATPTGSANTSTSSAADPTLAALDVQMRANLKSLMDDLKTAVAKNSAPAIAADTSSVGAAGAAAATQSLAPTPDSSASASAPTPDSLIKGALASADDFLKQLNNFYGTTPSTPTLANVSAVAANVVSTAGGSDDASLDTNTNSNNGNTNTALTTGSNNPGTATLAATDTSKTANPYSFASQLSATRAQNGGTVGLPTAVEQVLLQLNRNAKSGADTMSLQLHPADLGTINIKLDFATNGTVSGTVTANNADTLSMLQKDSRSLERALQEAGLRADPGSLQFNLGGQPNGSQHQPGQQNQASNSNASDTAGTGFASLSAGADTATTESWVITPGRVNIQV